MEFLYGNPFSTQVGQRVEQATDGSLQSEDWGLNMEICDIINETEDGPKDAIRALKKRLSGNKNFREVMLCLTVLETCVKNCGHRFHVLVASRDFVEDVLVKTILPKNNPPNIVQDKVLSLIQAWADAFRSTPDLTGVVTVYEELRRKGLEFPMTDLDALSPIHTPQRTIPEVDPAVSQNSVPAQAQSAVFPVSEQPIPVASTEGAITPSLEQVAKLRSELDIVNGNVKVMSEMLTEMVPGQEDPSDLELLQELNRTCRAMQQRILDLISRVTNEQVTEDLLHVNDNLNNIFLRYDRFERFRTGQKAVNRVPSVSENVDNLINLTPNSPAVVTPVAASNISTQMAGLSVTGESVSAIAKPLENSHPKTEEEFDMFAQTRSNSLADQRKSVKYEEPQAIEGLAGALDTRQQNTGAIPVTQANLMDDIEQWLSTDVKGELGNDSEGVTSEEFDKFLEERAKAAEQLPTLPSPPTEAPGSVNTSKKKQQEKTEDALFSL
ncbi:target of Myb1 membrane trafficking protein isoform X2 [Hemitrygon akajei]|uniref:target of Myb1 membrane trafficking protein isoform X2 n=1 Tax=Hemitrygon akajei TaxID=2704970 RepID=UPI003BFA0DCE